MRRDPELEAILAQGRQTRRPTPRWQWIAAAVVAVVCGAGFAVMMLADPGSPSVTARSSEPALERRPASAGGFGFGLVIGAGAGVVIGLAIARQRGDHSSRNRP